MEHTNAPMNTNGTTARRLNAILTRLGAARYREMTAAVERDALAGGVWIEHGADGARRPIDVMLRPHLLDLQSRAYAHHAAWQLRLALRAQSQLLVERPAAQALFPMDEAERAWLERYRWTEAIGQQRERVFCRLDALVHAEPGHWQPTMKFVEVNVVGIGGMTYAPALERALERHVAPALLEADERLTLARNLDPRELLLEDLRDHARALDPTVERPIVALIDAASLYQLGGEFGRLERHFAHHPDAAVLSIDPRELRVSHLGHVEARGQRIDLVYRSLELRELIAMEDAGDDLSGLHLAFAQNRVIPSVGGDLEHKSAFELLTNPSFTEHFDRHQRRIFRDHVLWTRLLTERRTQGPDGDAIDLVPWAARSRDRLVLKPNREYGGIGVVLGDEVSDADWDDALHRALANPGSHVVQELSPTPAEPVLQLSPDGALEEVTRYQAAGLIPGRSGLGIFARFAASRVVNVHAGGGVAAFMVHVT